MSDCFTNKISKKKSYYSSKNKAVYGIYGVAAQGKNTKCHKTSKGSKTT